MLVPVALYTCALHKLSLSFSIPLPNAIAEKLYSFSSISSSASSFVPSPPLLSYSHTFRLVAFVLSDISSSTLFQS
jgi:hypothetical protein